MKYIKILGLAAVAAMAIMAFVGAASASATTLCASEGGGAVMNCLGGKVSYGDNVNDRVVGTSTNATLSTSLANVVCSHSETTLNPNSSTGAPITGTVEALSFTGCETEALPHTPCTVNVVNVPYNASIEGTALTVTDAAGAGAEVVCGTVISCEFTTASAGLTVTNGSPTVATASNIPLSHENGLICPKTATWSATYSVTSPTGLTVL